MKKLLLFVLINILLGNYNSLDIKASSFTKSEISSKDCLYMDDLMNDVNLLNDAKIYKNQDNSKTLLLYTNEKKSSGVAWVKSKFYFDKGFETTFKFRISEPKNYGGNEDGGYLGADGFAFVMQSQGIDAIGPDAGELCYAGINNGIAIEYDMYKNTNERGYDFKDPSTCHIAIMYGKNKALSALHHPGNYILSKNADINSNGTIYYSKIVFDKDNNKFLIYFDSSMTFKTPFIEIVNFNISDYMDISNGAFFGFTGGSGYATQNCDILDWEICTNDEENEGTECDTSFFEYKNFSDVSGLSLVKNAQPSNDKLLLCQNSYYQSGIVWRDRALPLNCDWETEFSFSLNNPTQAKNPDNSYPGADGYALIIQNDEQGIKAIGNNGMGLAYDNLKNAIAIEIDLFKNNKYQLEDMNDPSGNHVAIIFPSKDGALSANHIYSEAEHISNDIPEIKSDNTVYYMKVLYRQKSKQLSIWLSDKPKYGNRVLKFDNLDLTKYINFQNGLNAYLGIGAATGDGFQNHYLHSWKFCASRNIDPLVVSSVTENQRNKQAYTLNCNDNNLRINRSSDKVYSEDDFFIKIYDNKGSEVYNSNLTFLNNSAEIDIYSLSFGTYFVRIIYNGEIIDIDKFIKK